MVEFGAESGRFNWNEGHGYRAPSPRPDGSPPPEANYAGMETQFAEEGPEVNFTSAGPQSVDSPLYKDPRLSGPSDAELEIARLAEEFISTGGPEGFVVVKTGAAVFLGHRLQLDPRRLNAIKQILALEVSETLEREKQRVLNEVQFAGLFGGPSGGWANVLEVPGSQTAMVPETPGHQLLRVRDGNAPAGTEDGSEVPGA